MPNIVASSAVTEEMNAAPMKCRCCAVDKNRSMFPRISMTTSGTKFHHSSTCKECLSTQRKKNYKDRQGILASDIPLRRGPKTIADKKPELIAFVKSLVAEGYNIAQIQRRMPTNCKCSRQTLYSLDKTGIFDETRATTQI